MEKYKPTYWRKVANIWMTLEDSDKVFPSLRKTESIAI